MNIILLIIDAITWCFSGYDDDWSVGRIVFVSAVVIAIVVLDACFTLTTLETDQFFGPKALWFSQARATPW